MRKILLSGLVAASLATVGCGNDAEENAKYDFTGMWMGALSSASVTCSDGSSVQAESSQVSFTIMTAGNSQIFWHAKCGDLYFDQHGNIATQSRAVTCPPTTTPTSLVTGTIRDTALVLNGNALQVDLFTDYTVAASGKTGSCKNIHASGVLVRTGGN